MAKEFHRSNVKKKQQIPRKKLVSFINQEMYIILSYAFYAHIASLFR